MEDTIFLIGNDGKLRELKESEYLSENQLQELLANHPNLLSGKQIEPENPRKWILISREFGIPGDKDSGNRWSLDHLFLDQDGIPTLVEVKRSSDTRIRREVIGQIFDYAANAILYWKIEEVINLFEKTCDENGINSQEKLEEFLSFDLEIDDFWELVKTNLRAGKIRMLIISDAIPKELQRIIEFLNGQMSPAEILGVEIKQFKTENFKTLVPRVIGKTINTQNRKSTSQRANNWTEESFFTAFKEADKIKEFEIAKSIFEWAKNKCSRVWFGAGRRGSLVPIVNVDRDHQLFAIWTDGSIEIYFQWYSGKPPFDDEEKRLMILDKLNSIKGVNIPRSKISKRPNFPLKLLYPQEERKKFLEIYEWFISQLNE
jgi:hypothetical protein